MARYGSLALVLATVACSSNAPRGDDTPPNDDVRSPPPAKPLALVYRGPATCDVDGGGCAPAWADMFKSCQPGFDVVFVGPNEHDDVTRDVLSKAQVFIYPGGNDSIAKDWPHVAAYKPAIQEFVRNGGRYLGSCTGGYLAAVNPWAGPDIGFALLPGNAGEYIASPGADIKTTKDTIVDVIWKDVWGDAPHPIYLQDGTFFEKANAAAPGVLVLATYAANGEIAALVAPYGKGKVGVEGPHAEAPLDWYTANGVDGRPDFAPGCDLVTKTLAP
jgi:hypothetical protein